MVGAQRWRGRLAAVAMVGAVILAGSPLAGGATPPRYQFGINSYVTYRCQPASTYLSWASSQVNEYASLKANSIALAFPLYTTSLESNDVFGALNCKTGKYQTPPPWLLAKIVGIAHSHGIRVLIRPLIDVEAPYPESTYAWSGLLRPTDLATWIQHYQATLGPYLAMAQQTHVEHFAIDSELNSIATKGAFGSVVATAKRSYSGDLVANYTWSSRFGKRLWSGTSPGVDTYPKIHDISPSQRAGSILGQWDWLLANRRAYSLPSIRRETIDEIGIPAQDGAYAEPSSGSLPPGTHPFNPIVQARWFIAACRFMKEHRMQGIYYWGQWMASMHGHLLTSPSASHPSLLQPATQEAIKGCFSS